MEVQQLELSGTVWWVAEDRFPYIHSAGPDRFTDLIGFMYRFQSRRMLDAATVAIESVNSGEKEESVIGADDFCVYFYADHAPTGLKAVAELLFLWEMDNFHVMPTSAFERLINQLTQLRTTIEPSPITTCIYDVSSEYRRPYSVYEYDDEDD